MPPKLPPHVRMVKNRVGRTYLYLQRNRGTGRAEKPVRLPDDPTSAEFWGEYARLMQLPVAEVNSNAISELVREWHQSREWKAMADKTQIEWSRYSSRIVAAWGTLEARGIEPRHVLALRDRYGDTPAAANNLLRCLSSMMAWCVPRGYRADNPCREIKPLKAGDGYQPWPWPLIETTQAVIRPDLGWCVSLALYTGQRKGDVLAMRWDAIQGNVIAVRQEKTGKRLAIPLHKDLCTVLNGIPRRATTILTSTDGTPWTGSGFNSSWRKYRPPQTRGWVFHGLRKSAVVTLLECGCTDAEVASITGQSRQMVEHYAREVNQSKLATAAIYKWETGRTGTEP